MKNRWQVTGVVVKQGRGGGEYNNVLLTVSDTLDHWILRVCVGRYNAPLYGLLSDFFCLKSNLNIFMFYIALGFIAF